MADTLGHKRSLIYLDHAATAFPRSPKVVEAMVSALTSVTSPHRGDHLLAEAAAHLLDRCRRTAADLFGVKDPRRVVFTSGCTDAINQVLHGSLQLGDRVIACIADHNAVLRPLHALALDGVRVQLLAADRSARIDLDRLSEVLKQERCRLLVLTHASNVTGAILELEPCLKIARATDVPVLVDAAQSAGFLDLDVDAMGKVAVAIAGHKGIGGPPGIGLICLGEDFSFAPVRQGGSGNDSASANMPTYPPDRYEAGTPNVPGIAGLMAALEAPFIDLAHIIRLRKLLWNTLSNLRGVTCYGPGPDETSLPIVSFTIDSMSPELIANHLDENGICVRAGLHCAPGAHKSIGSFECGGTVRISFGPTNTKTDIDRLADILATLSDYEAATISPPLR